MLSLLMQICVFDCENGILKSTMLVETSFTRGSIVKHLAFRSASILSAYRRQLYAYAS